MTKAARAKKNVLMKPFAHAISEHYRDFEHAYVYWIWLRGSASYVKKPNEITGYVTVHISARVTPAKCNQRALRECRCVQDTKLMISSW